MTDPYYFRLLIGKTILDVRQEISVTIPINDADPEKILMEIPLMLLLEEYEVSIYNKWALIGDCTHIKQLIDRTILSVKMEGYSLVFELDGPIEIRVDVSDDGYIGPEAIVLNGPDNLSVVWN
jgi:hypothetical protein